MKKSLICILALCIILLAGCGNIKEKNDSVDTLGTLEIETSETYAASDISNTLNGSDTILWEQNVQVDNCEMFQKSDLIKYDENSATWDNDKGYARLNTIDNKETYLTYKSELGECSDIQFDYVQDKSITGTKFYEEDVNSDGYKELLISYTQATGTGANYGALSIYDLNNNELIPLFTKNDFSDAQKKDIFKTISTWNTYGFQEKSGLGINDESNIKSGYFVPTLVKVNENYMVQVKYLLRDPIKYYDYNNSKLFYALLEFHDDQLKVNNLWCKL